MFREKFPIEWYDGPVEVVTRNRRVVFDSGGEGAGIRLPSSIVCVAMGGT
jgi:hypothetical protein